MDKKIITIRPIVHRDNEYIAYIKDRFLGATFAVCFTDCITGAIALNNFNKMVERHYEESTVELLLSNNKCRFKSAAMLDLMTDREDTDGHERSVYKVGT